MPVTRSQVKYIQSLGHKKFRDAEGVFVAEGPKLAGELLAASNCRPVQLFATKEWIAVTGLEPGGLVTEVSQGELERLSGQATPNQVVGVFEKPKFNKPDWRSGLHLVLDGIQDPGNLGTIVRIADWFGIGLVLCSPDSADVFGPKAVQSTMGSIGRVQVVYNEPVEVVGQGGGMPVFATVLDGEGLYGMSRTDSGWILVGNESKGIGPELQRLATRRITIPRIGHAESLNAAVAAGIILSHLAGEGTAT
jgi:TrmH family RNA methyltransferase